MPYSPDIHPLPELRKNSGTDSSTDAVQMTRVLPISINADPSAVEMKSGIMLTGRICSGVRLSLRKIIRQNSNSRRPDQLSALSYQLSVTLFAVHSAFTASSPSRTVAVIAFFAQIVFFGQIVVLTSLDP